MKQASCWWKARVIQVCVSSLARFANVLHALQRQQASVGCLHMQVLIDNGSIADEVQKAGRVDKLLELVGGTTLKDSLRCVKPHGLVCMAGIVGGARTLPVFNPMEAIPNAVGLTSYSGGPDEFMSTPLDELVQDIKVGKMHIPIGKVFSIDNIVEAHRCMESNSAGGKIVVLT